MSKSRVFWIRLLEGLICLCPMGAFEYYLACTAPEAPAPSPVVAWRPHVVAA